MPRFGICLPPLGPPRRRAPLLLLGRVSPPVEKLEDVMQLLKEARGDLSNDWNISRWKQNLFFNRRSPKRFSRLSPHAGQSGGLIG
jgi:hypothetical protein